jgi:hypothetical protein
MQKHTYCFVFDRWHKIIDVWSSILLTCYVFYDPKTFHEVLDFNKAKLSSGPFYFHSFLNNHIFKTACVPSPLGVGLSAGQKISTLHYQEIIVIAGSDPQSHWNHSKTDGTAGRSPQWRNFFVFSYGGHPGRMEILSIVFKSRAWALPFRGRGRGVASLLRITSLFIKANGLTALNYMNTSDPRAYALG